MKRFWLVCVVVALAAAGLVWWCARTPSEKVAGESSPKVSAIRSETPSAPAEPAAGETAESAGDGEDAEAEEAESDDAAAEEEEPQTEEERAEAEAEKAVDAFDGMTDAWQEPAKGGVSMKDVEAFVAAFRKVPKDRKDECVHRALNLVPDENVMLLAGILMDKAEDKEIVETVYNDILNRNEDVKMPILREVFKDKTHPCWADTAWILDVTGSLPAKTK